MDGGIKEGDVAAGPQHSSVHRMPCNVGPSEMSIELICLFNKQVFIIS